MTKKPLGTWHVIKNMIWQQRGLYSLNTVLWGLVFTIPLLEGLLSKLFFDTLEKRPLELNISSIIALVMVIALARAASIFGGMAADIPWRFRISALLRRNLLAHILERPGARALPVSVGEAISTFRDDPNMVEETSDWTLDVSSRVIFLISALVILFSINARITVLVFVPLAIVMSLTYFYGSKLEKLREQSRDSTAKVTGALGEMFGAVQGIQVAGAEARVIAHFKRLGDVRRAALLRDNVQTQVLNAIYGNVVQFGTGFILLLAAAEMREKTFTIGDFAVFAMYLERVAHTTEFFGHFMSTMRQTTVSIKRMVELLQGASHQKLIKEHSIPLSGKLPTLEIREKTALDKLQRFEIRNLGYAFDGNARGIQNINLRLERGSFTVITGRIGSGKTTLLRAMLGLLEPQTGTVFWNGTPATAHDLIPPRVAYTSQVPVLFTGTLRENILLGLPNDPRKLEQAVKNAVLEQDLAGFEDGFETRIGSKGVKLSGGQVFEPPPPECSCANPNC